MAACFQATTYWAPWFRSVLGIREDVLHGTDTGAYYGSAHSHLAEPKVSLIATPYDDGTGHVGTYLPNAPFAAGSLSIYVKCLGHWDGGLEYRHVDSHPLSSDDQIQGHGYGGWNGDIHYSFQDGWKIGLGPYNILNVRANAAGFWYVDRLPGEPVAGVAVVHIHPLEPLSFRFTVEKMF